MKVSTPEIYTDFQGLRTLGKQAQSQQKQNLDAVAKQFESVFLQMALKSMRSANLPLSSELFKSNAMASYQDMFDNQLSLQLAGKRLGIAELLKQQLARDPRYKELLGEEALGSKSSLNSSHNLGSSFVRKANHLTAVSVPQKSEFPAISGKSENNQSSFDGSFDSRLEFIKTLWLEAKKASELLGTHPAVLIAQAALETDWGRKIIRHKDGQISFNLFNIKAGSSWDKESVTVKTLEYKDGVVNKERAAFRSYHSFSESFEDYVRLLKNNSRYDQAVQNAANPKQFLQALQTGGYATDPNYAKKILNILDGSIFQNLFSGF